MPINLRPTWNDAAMPSYSEQDLPQAITIVKYVVVLALSISIAGCSFFGEQSRNFGITVSNKTATPFNGTLTFGYVSNNNTLINTTLDLHLMPNTYQVVFEELMPADRGSLRFEMRGDNGVYFSKEYYWLAYNGQNWAYLVIKENEVDISLPIH